ncbi:flagellar motor protein MotB [Pelagibius sp. 7325]|uniref:flagellar motor protein MotB n=1 Tax=Pelagibius sp. 7325 TaxID=3131994 RepID=UPI0030EB300B
MAGGIPRSGTGQSNGNIIALLSLNILLLAFFILLNSLSSFEEERRDAVMDSVRQAFQGLVPADRNVQATPAAADIFEGAQEAVDSLSQLFGDGLPLVESRDAAGRWILQVDMPVADLFADDSNDLLPDGAETLRLIASVMADPRFARAGFEVDVFYGLRGSASGVDGNREAMARAGALVRALEREGMPPASLSAGLLPAFPGQVRFHFTIQVDAPPSAGTGNGG